MAGRHRKPPYGRGRHRQPSQPGRWASPVLAALIVLGISGVGAVTARSDHGGVTTPTARSSTPAPTHAGSSTPSPAPTSSSVAPSATRPTHSRPKQPTARFELTVTGRVAWVSVAVPGRRTLFAGLLRPGRTLRFDAHPLAVVIGDAGAVRVAVHGQVHDPAGRSGEVVHLTVR